MLLPPHLAERLHSGDGDVALNDRIGRDMAVQRLERRQGVLHARPKTARRRSWWYFAISRRSFGTPPISVAGGCVTDLPF